MNCNVPNYHNYGFLRQQIKTIIDNFDTISTFQKDLQAIDLNNVVDYVETFEQHLRLEKISNKLFKSFGKSDPELTSALNNFKTEVDNAWTLFEQKFIPELIQKLLETNEHQVKLLSLLVRRDLIDAENFEQNFDCHPRFMQAKFIEQFHEALLSMLPNDTNIQTRSIFNRLINC